VGRPAYPLGVRPTTLPTHTFMDWRTDWLALHDRIEGVEQAANLYIRALRVSSEDPYAVRRKVFRSEFQALEQIIREFREAHGRALPSTAVATLDRFIKTHGPLLANNDLDNFGHTVACVTALSGFRAELRFQLTDRGATLLRITERALIHLQRTLVADTAAREKWQGAFATGEIACEQLGAVHLLLHGIWAFKTSAAGERTDLVYGEPISNFEVAAAADALVLTEWKVVRNSSELSEKLTSAEAQARLYSQGILGGLELSDSRFIIVVSRDRVILPLDSEVSGVFYRRRNIAVVPSTPSRSAAVRG
jgi:hypothetical protein